MSGKDWRKARRGFLCLLPVFALAAVFWFFDFETINTHHVLWTSIAGFAVGLPLLIWRTMVASDQLETSLRIADTANKNLTDSIFANGVNMLGEEATATRWGGINTLIRLVDEHPEYMNDVMLSLCPFLRHERESNEQKLRILDAVNRWGKKDPDSIAFAALDLQGIQVSGANLDSIRLTNVDLSHAQISRSVMESIDFSGGDFSKFRCVGTSFRCCNFDGAILPSASFEGVDFTGCTFEGADISDVHLNNAGLLGGGQRLIVTQAQLEKAHWGKAPQINLAVHDAETAEPIRLRRA